MYTIDDRREDFDDEDEYVENSSWDNNKGLIFKIIIIILCIIVLIWLIKALKGKNNLADDNEVHAANVEKVRLAAENYFFIENNKDKTNSVSLATLKSDGLIHDIVDANKKVCNANSTKVDLNKESNSYAMTIKLSCSTNDKSEVFYYNNSTLACLNCDGKTNMAGKNLVVADKEEKKEEPKKEETVEKTEYIPEYHDEYSDYSCIEWSNWSKDRVFDASLTERSRTLVTGVKYGSDITYGEWSEYTTTPVVSSADLEIETKTITESIWSDTKTSTNIDTSNNNIRLLTTKVINVDGDKCDDGYIENGVCYSNQVTVGNLTTREYNSGKYKIKNGQCNGVQTLLNNEGKYVLTYVGCMYNEAIKTIEKASKSYTLYTYQELETTDVTYYRYRTINKTSEPDKYTDEKYEEKDLPEGYVKLEGSEETYYSYKLTTCVK